MVVPPWDTLLVFTLAAAAMGISPGPSNLYVVARTLDAGWRGGALAALGLALGSLVHVLLVVLGAAALLAAAPGLIWLVRALGALWLAWLGWQTWRAVAASGMPVPVPARHSARRVFRESVLVEVTNPKTAVFFLAFLPQFVDPALGGLASQLFVLGAIVTVAGLLSDLLVTAVASRAAGWLQGPVAVVWRARTSAAVLLLLAGWLALGLMLDIVA